jgi:ADP-heptose:LPS heptosyltransferase
MLDSWNVLQRFLIVQLGNDAELEDRMHLLLERSPQAEFILLCKPEVSWTGHSVLGIRQVLTHRALSDLHDVESVLDLIDILKANVFDAAIIFPFELDSPYPIAYLCYLAEIPIRIGQSIEFGGGVLSHSIQEVVGLM